MDVLNNIVKLIGTVAVIDLIAVLMAGTHSFTKLAHSKSRLIRHVLLGVVGGLFGMFATVASSTVEGGAQVSVRDVGALLGGALGGPLGGLIAGGLAGLFRLLFPFMTGGKSLLDGTTIPCAFSTLTIGIISGFFHEAFKKAKHRGLWGLLMGFVAEVYHLSIVFAYLCIPMDVEGLTPSHSVGEAWTVISQVALPFLIANSIAFGLLIYVFDKMRSYRDTEAHARQVEGELSVATNIQDSMLPKIFPNYPGREEFTLYASMNPAKEVGGDFYDFFFVDDDHFAFLIADVSGKGVPAALFMVIAKTIIKNNVQSGLPLDEAMTKSNQQLLEGDDERMFVTCWIGVLEISTGELTYVNCGHNPPVMKFGDQPVGFVKDLSGFILAGSKKTKYKSYTRKLAAGDKIFLYTDGVTEAMNKSSEQFGEQRLLDTLSKVDPHIEAEPLVQEIGEAVKAHADGAEQSDDITMLAFRLNGFVKSLKVEAKTANFATVSSFLEQELQGASVPSSLISKMDVVIDEIFSNVVKYSGSPDLTFSVLVADGQIHLRFVYGGVPFDLTKAPEPDLSVPLEKRGEGGLGILMVKKLTDQLQYEYANGLNIVKIEKGF